MKFMLDCGSNLLVYGVGSKYELMKNFVRRTLSNEQVSVFEGFDPRCTVKKVVDTAV